MCRRRRGAARCSDGLVPLPRSALVLLSLAAQCVRQAAGGATVDVTRSVEQEDPYMRRIMLLLVMPLTCALVYHSTKMYFPDRSFGDVVAEVREAAGAAPASSAPAAAKPKWWEGGVLGKAASIAKVRLDPRSSSSSSSTPSRGAAFNPLNAWKRRRDGDEDPPAATTTTETPETAPSSDTVVVPIVEPVAVAAAAVPPPPPPPPSTDVVVCEEEDRRAVLCRHAAEDRFSLARERDVARKRVWIAERRAAEAAEAAARDAVAAAADEALHRTVLRLWEEHGARAAVAEREVDARYAAVSEEAGCRRALGAEEFDRRIVAATAVQRAALAEEEAAARDYAEAGEEVGRRRFEGAGPRLWLEAAAAASQAEGARHEAAARAVLRVSACVGEEAAARAALAREAAEGTEGVELAETQRRLGVRAAEDFHRATLRGIRVEERRRLNVRMVVRVEGAVVRASVDKRSQTVARLAEGSVVEVEEVVRGRARIAEPAGWVSLKGQTGQTILSSKEDEEARVAAAAEAEVAAAAAAAAAAASAAAAGGEGDGEREEFTSLLKRSVDSVPWSLPSVGTPASSPSPVAADSAAVAAAVAAEESDGPTAAPRSPASSMVSSNLLEDFCEVELFKSTPDQKLGICFAPGSRLVLSQCVEGSAAQLSGLDRVLGHRLVKVNDTAVKDKAGIARFAREERLHLVFSKQADRGWNERTQTWTAPLLSLNTAEDIASSALSGLRGGLGGLRGAVGKQLRPTSSSSPAVPPAAPPAAASTPRSAGGASVRGASPSLPSPHSPPTAKSLLAMKGKKGD